MLYSVNEIFYSIQGEGYHAGKTALFIRLAGCNLECDFCDTDHTEKMQLSAKDIIKELEDIRPQDYTNPYPFVVITGGEPLQQDLTELVNSLKLVGYKIHLETNGTWHPNDIPIIDQMDWVTVSPKYHAKKMITLMTPLQILKDKSNEIKIVMDSGVDLDKFKHFPRKFIQPMSQQFQRAVDFVKENPSWRLSVQTQKILNIL